MSVTPMAPRLLLIVEPMFFCLGRFLRFPLRTNAVRPGRNDQPRDPLDIYFFLFLLSYLTRHSCCNYHVAPTPPSLGAQLRDSRPLPTTPSSPSSFTPRILNVSFWWPVCGGHTQPRIIDVPLAQAKERNAAAGATKKDEDIVPDENLDPPSPNCDSQQPAAAMQPSTGEHGVDRSCFCF
ncbi:hypothetical protein EDD22DRAFT_959886 [Suillus occidentalis]|nr:hypothetical protein EDD22DRAFT_959886 [Suillus occidentalis]